MGTFFEPFIIGISILTSLELLFFSEIKEYVRKYRRELRTIPSTIINLRELYFDKIEYELDLAQIGAYMKLLRDQVETLEEFFPNDEFYALENQIFKLIKASQFHSQVNSHDVMGLQELNVQLTSSIEEYINSIYRWMINDFMEPESSCTESNNEKFEPQTADFSTISVVPQQGPTANELRFDLSFRLWTLLLNLQFVLPQTFEPNSTRYILAIKEAGNDGKRIEIQSSGTKDYYSPSFWLNSIMIPQLLKHEHSNVFSPLYHVSNYFHSHRGILTKSNYRRIFGNDFSMDGLYRSLVTNELSLALEFFIDISKGPSFLQSAETFDQLIDSLLECNCPPVEKLPFPKSRSNDFSTRVLFWAVYAARFGYKIRYSTQGSYEILIDNLSPWDWFEENARCSETTKDKILKIVYSRAVTEEQRDEGYISHNIVYILLGMRVAEFVAAYQDKYDFYE